MPPNQPVNPAPQPQVTPPQTPLFPQVPPRQVVQSEVNKAVYDIQKEWRSPAFWMHLAVQFVSWYSFSSTGSGGVRVGTLGVSATSLIAYLWHLASVRPK